MGFPTPHLRLLEQRAIRLMASSGGGIKEIAIAFGRTQETVVRHTGYLLSMRVRARRLERLFAACNRALNEARI